MLIYTLFQPIYIGKCLNIRCKSRQNTFNIKEKQHKTYKNENNKEHTLRIWGTNKQKTLLVFLHPTYE